MFISSILTCSIFPLFYFIASVSGKEPGCCLGVLGASAAGGEEAWWPASLHVGHRPLRVLRVLWRG